MIFDKLIKWLAKEAYEKGEDAGYWRCDKDHNEADEMEAQTEAHRTEEGYCCACDYDMAKMEDKIEEAINRKVKRIAKLLPHVVQEKLESKFIFKERK
ncbi:hypothetical protein LCGC14_1943160 [marine sediment metagenome]|uniref:Uncharacterized protein n=1 Tax=marine sediment metagenome TaxID=412755 RepID=A0A0F9FJY6_9ZZZZ